MGLLKSKVMIYGANGYTGQLILEECKNNNFEVIIAGRNIEKLKILSEKFGYEERAFSLSENFTDKFDDIYLVLNCAGPFSKTAKPIVDACILTGTHYLDITAEIDVFEMIKQRNVEAVDKDVLLLPGIGFDVIPTDCMAKFLSEKLDNAVSLEIGIYFDHGISKGTQYTNVERLKLGGAIRKDGEIVKTKLLGRSKVLTFYDIDGRKFENLTYQIPWGDISTSYTTTSIPNIEVYLNYPKKIVRLAKISHYFKWLFKFGFIENIMKKMMVRIMKPVEMDKVDEGHLNLRATARNNNGEELSISLNTINSYKFTAISSIFMIKKVLDGDFRSGYYTPAGLYGSNLITEIDPISEIKLISQEIEA
jgi:short subunit dehydrogenase-like uncharacterized protein